jgi:hypothetical protein
MELLLVVTYVLLGALDITMAINNFKQGFHFLGCLLSMAALWIIIALFKLAIGG